jgi:hypothetical protein
MIPGFVISSTPIEVLFLYPPEIPLINAFPILTSAHDFNPRSNINSLTLYYNLLYDRFKVNLAANKKLSLGVNVPNNASSCITYPI